MELSVLSPLGKTVTDVLGCMCVRTHTIYIHLNEVYVSVDVCPHECSCPWRLEEGGAAWS